MLGRGALGKSSLTLQTGEWDAFPEPLLVRDFTAFAERLAARPPRLLDSRVLAKSLHAVRIHDVSEVRYFGGEQELQVTIFDDAGTPMRVVAGYRHVAKHALPALAAALHGKHGRPRFLAGDLRLDAQGLILSPISVVCDRMIALDIAGAELGDELTRAFVEASIRLRMTAEAAFEAGG